jgi:hypothetical protein
VRGAWEIELPSLGFTSIGTELDLTPIQPQGAGATRAAARGVGFPDDPAPRTGVILKAATPGRHHDSHHSQAGSGWSLKQQRGGAGPGHGGLAFLPWSAVFPCNTTIISLDL